MENDQIKSQIESAKKAFIANKERGREASEGDVETAGKKEQRQTSTQDRQLQEDIMSRVSGLMDEAAQTSAAASTNPVIPQSKIAENRARPFWAQNRVDIPPSEQFGKRQKMQEQDESDKNSQSGISTQRIHAETGAFSNLPTADPLTAIREEVINRLGDATGQVGELQEFTGRLQQLEDRADKQQQDLTALLKLVRQLANRQAELEQEKSQPSHQRGLLFWPLILVLLVLLAGSAGWLYWMNPDLMISLSANLLNKGFDFALHLVARTGLL